MEVELGRPPSVCEAEIWTTGRIGRQAADKLKELSLKSLIKPKLLDQKAILQELSPDIRERCKRMLASIAMADDTHADDASLDGEAPAEGRREVPVRQGRSARLDPAFAAVLRHGIRAHKTGQEGTEIDADIEGNDEASPDE